MFRGVQRCQSAVAEVSGCSKVGLWTTVDDRELRTVLDQEWMGAGNRAKKLGKVRSKQLLTGDKVGS